MNTHCRRGFSRIRISFEIGGTTPIEKLEKLVELTERYCVVFQTLAQPPEIVVRQAPPAGERQASANGGWSEPTAS